jgi:ribosomal protein S21
MRNVLVALVICATSALAHVSVPSATFAAPMVSRVPRTSAASNVVMDNHVHRAQISVGDNEPIEAAVKRFRREVSRSGHLPLLRSRKRFSSPAEIRQNILKKEARRLRFVPPAQR